MNNMIKTRYYPANANNRKSLGDYPLYNKKGVVVLHEE